jgi:hypothetical protein
MKSKSLYCIHFAAALLFMFPLNATAASTPSAAELDAITGRGRLLAAYDWVAWNATNAVMAAHPKADPAGRYIARKIDAGWVVDFGRLSATGDAFLVVDEAAQMNGSAKFQVKTFDAVRRDTGWNLSAARAIEIASGDFGETNRPYNIAVLPAGAGGLYVYLYPAQTDAAVYPLGGDVPQCSKPHHPERRFRSADSHNSAERSDADHDGSGQYGTRYPDKYVHRQQWSKDIGNDTDWSDSNYR